jgi:RNase P/RNase MRP subunit p29
LPNGDPFIPRSAAFKTSMPVQKDFCKDPEITALDSKIAAATKQSSVDVSGYIRDSLKRVITLMTQEKVNQVAFYLAKLTKHINNFLFKNHSPTCGGMNCQQHAAPSIVLCHSLMNWRSTLLGVEPGTTVRSNPGS